MEQTDHDEIKKLKFDRGIIKAKLTRLETFLNIIENREKIEQIRTRLEAIEQEFKNFDIIQTRLEYLDESEVVERDSLENKFYEVIAEAKRCVQVSEAKLGSTALIATPTTSNVQTVPVTENKFTKLPDIELPNFHGTYETWMSFFDIFKSVVHERTDLSDIQKFLYLKACCKDDALRLIDSIKVTSENYTTAVELLRERFENKRAIINHHVNGLLFKLPDVSKESPGSLRKLVDTVNQHVKSLAKLELPTDHWDALLIPLIVKKLDLFTRREWESKQTSNDLPKLSQLMEFLTKKCVTLEVLFSEINVKSHSSNVKGHNVSNKQFSSKISTVKSLQQSYALTNTYICPTCQGKHFIYQCPEFEKRSLDEKYKEVRRLKLCSNCLRSGHGVQVCKSRHCNKCNLKHNTLLHEDKNRSTDQSINSANNSASTSESSTDIATHSTNFHLLNTKIHESEQITLSHASIQLNQVLLSTATILIKDRGGRYHECTALLDGGSQSNLISKRLCQKLDLDLEDFLLPLAGINKNVTHITNKVSVTIKSRCTPYQVQLSCLVLQVITENLPLIGFDKKCLQYPTDIPLADDSFNEPKSIDILLGAEIFYDLLEGEKIILGKNNPTLHKTKLGWIFTGVIKLHGNSRHSKTVCNLTTKISHESLNQTMQRFWQLEEIPQNHILNQEEQLCENYFQQTTTRSEDGKFVVRLPFKENFQELLGESQSCCIQRFRGLENRLSNNESLKNDYHNFMQEYEALHHMSSKFDLYSFSPEEKESYFLPHHAVIKHSSTTTKCRVVFDGSARTSTGYSLNDLLAVGPLVQDDLFSIVTRMRLRKYVLNADIKMMYRQIWLHPNDRKYQLILWRFNSDQPIKIYELNTVTYGHSSSPYLATRCLKHLAEINANTYPQTSHILEKSFYMDDLLTSVDSIPEALEVYHEITSVLNTAGFQLRKWSSNSREILNHIVNDNANLEGEQNLILIHDRKELKTLGLMWNSEDDTLNYTIKFIDNPTVITKRTVLSAISQLFDPLGLVGAAVIRAKILMQQIWKSSLDWDDPLTGELLLQWETFSSQLHALNSVKIPRHVVCENPVQVELVGFCDASEKAYGVCIYLVSTDTNGQKYSNLLCAKSKVAPLKKITLPRLELLAAVLLARLMTTIRNTIDITIDATKLYSDSTIVLSWLRIDPSTLKTFVANRVTLILELTHIEEWNHVKSEFNAADIISRGINPSELFDCNIWWHGPEFLIQIHEANDFIMEEFSTENLPEVKIHSVSLATSKTDNFLSNLITKFSTLNKLQRVVAYVCRFTHRLISKQSITSAILNVDELERALLVLIKFVQHEAFSSEISALQQSRNIKNHSKIINLNPFIDESGILRVGGRLANSDLPYDQKHPIILPYKHKLTSLIIQHEHLKHLHAGVQNLLSILRLRYWPIKGKNMVKSVTRSCIRCYRVNPKPATHIMGNLPRNRVTPGRPFLRCGIDYAGPILVKDGSLRTSKVRKSYICIFVCFAVRAVHIELVLDLTTDGFLNALKRFISRRGKPTDIFTDNGLNFVGASNHFTELFKLLSDNNHNQIVSQFLAKDMIKWHFIPPKSPHIGGLWEAMVKSTKYHLRRTLGNATVTYDEMYTILTQIEACLNSRPLTALSDDPNDFLPLTPSHFLIGDSLVATPQADVEDMPCNRLSRYQRMQQLVQLFWTRWSREYLGQLQKRSKWHQHQMSDLHVGSLVILMEDHIPPLRWPMARILELHPGADQIVRVVSVKTANGAVVKRSLRKICALPEDNEPDEA